MSDIRNFEIDLDIKQNLLVTVNCKQLDNLNLKFNIWDNGQVADLSNYRCRLKASKSDQVPFIQNTDISINGNIITIEADEQLTTTSGNVKTELQFIDKTNSKKKTSFDLNIKVISSALEVNRSISKATVTLLEELDNKLDQVEDIGIVLDEAKGVKDTLESNITNGNVTYNNILKSISNAEDKKQEINTIINNASSKIIEVETVITNANSSKGNLDNSKANADITKTNLDTANTQATKNIEALNALGDVTNLAQQVETNKTNIDDLNLNKTNILKTNSESFGYGVISGLLVSAQDTANMTVKYASGVVHLVDGTRKDITGGNLTIEPADITNARIDVIYISEGGVPTVLKGIASASPIVPTLPNNSILLSQISVIAKATTITNDKVSDKRVLVLSNKDITTQLNAKANKNNAEFTGTMILNTKDVATYEKFEPTFLNGWQNATDNVWQPLTFYKIGNICFIVGILESSSLLTEGRQSPICINTKFLPKNHFISIVKVDNEWHDFIYDKTGNMYVTGQIPANKRVHFSFCIGEVN